ncbi:Uncharacterised protein [Vibrio cholerae]|nr:Uncharacterised protein [Vibrio cholerae]CSC71557.1 Uncharacterised protein [Vibrio cholerae]
MKSITNATGSCRSLVIATQVCFTLSKTAQNKPCTKCYITNLLPAH